MPSSPGLAAGDARQPLQVPFVTPNSGSGQGHESTVFLFQDSFKNEDGWDQPGP